MQAIKDAAIVLILVLLAATIRVTPLDDVAELVPDAQAAAQRPAGADEAPPVLRPSSCTGEETLEPAQLLRPWTPPPMGTEQPAGGGKVRDDRARVRVWTKRDRPLVLWIEPSEEKADPQPRALESDSAC
jgi:hypothetical protein